MKCRICFRDQFHTLRVEFVFCKINFTHISTNGLPSIFFSASKRAIVTTFYFRKRCVTTRAYIHTQHKYRLFSFYVIPGAAIKFLITSANSRVQFIPFSFFVLSLFLFLSHIPTRKVNAIPSHTLAIARRPKGRCNAMNACRRARSLVCSPIVHDRRSR